MFRRPHAETPHAALVRAIAIVMALIVPAALQVRAFAQDLVNPDSPDAVVERYLQLHGLDQLRAAQLRQRLANAAGDERVAIAERLGDMYAEMLGKDITPERRQEIESRSRDLFNLVPDIDSYGLRIKLAKARYLPAERTAERWRLALTDPGEAAEAQRVLQELRDQFQSLGRTLNQRVEALDRQQRRGADVDQTSISSQLAEFISERSSAMYYAGWSGYYLALLSDRPDIATDAMRDLGWMLGTEGGLPTLDHLKSALLNYEHVGRAALAIAMCKSLQGDSGGAMSWIRLMDANAELHPAVREQLFSREADILARAGRWDELKDLVVQRRADKPLQVADARLIAVLAMKQNVGGSYAERETPQVLASVAIGDLITRGEVAHVLDLLRRFGTLPLGGDGFVVDYVRGLLAYEQARDAHKQAGEDVSLPTQTQAVAQNYSASADLLQAAFEADDARSFSTERVRAGMTWGLSEYYSNRMMEAAKALEQTAIAAGQGDQREEALWMAIVALDRATQAGNEQARQWAERLSTLYISEFPSTDRAAVLLLRQPDASEVDTEHAIEVLFSVKQSSSIYESARRHLGRLLYQTYRHAPASQRDAEAARFLQVADELLDMDEKLVASGDSKKAAEAAAAIVVRVRQILDVVLSSRAPELSRAERALDRLEHVANQMGLGLGELQGELTYRRLQIALIRGQDERVEELLADLTRIGGRFLHAAERELYRHAVDDWNAPNAGEAEAKALVRFGGRILANPDEPGDRLSDRALLGVAERVSHAAGYLWEHTNDENMRSLALRLTGEWFDKGLWTEPMLRQLADLAEQTGDKKRAFDAWKTLSAAYEQGEPTWFEARYNTIRLLASVDPQTAREAMSQFKIMYPSFGPQPWAEKLKALDARLQVLPDVPTPGEETP